MFIYYAVGGGLGHLTRTTALLHQWGLPLEQGILLTASPFAKPPYIPAELRVFQIPPHFATNLEAYQDWLAHIIQRHRVQIIYLDAFPGGIVGEWNNFPGQETLQFYYIARILQWQSYQSVTKCSPPFFRETFVLEELEEAHRLFVQQYSEKVTKWTLQYPVKELSLKNKALLATIYTPQHPLWAIVHSTPLKEIHAIWRYAQEISQTQQITPHWLFITPEYKKITPSSDVTALSAYPASAFFNHADQIFTACGFNAMNQLQNYRDKHHFLPFQRKFDNQFLRASRCRSKQYLAK